MEVFGILYFDVSKKLKELDEEIAALRQRLEKLPSMHRIPVRYECALELGDVKIFPDFTIMHPETKELFFWEYFGMMDNASYARSAFDKMRLYNMHGITLSIQLIMTFETQEHPLTSDEIKSIIQNNFTCSFA